MFSCLSSVTSAYNYDGFFFHMFNRLYFIIGAFCDKDSCFIIFVSYVKSQLYDPVRRAFISLRWSFWLLISIIRTDTISKIFSFRFELIFTLFYLKKVLSYFLLLCQKLSVFNLVDLAEFLLVHVHEASVILVYFDARSHWCSISNWFALSTSTTLVENWFYKVHFLFLFSLN